MDPVSAEFLDRLDVPFIKIGSGDANNLPMMVKVIGLSVTRPVIGQRLQILRSHWLIIKEHL